MITEYHVSACRFKVNWPVTRQGLPCMHACRCWRRCMRCDMKIMFSLSPVFMVRWLSLFCSSCGITPIPKESGPSLLLAYCCPLSGSTYKFHRSRALVPFSVHYIYIPYIRESLHCCLHTVKKRLITHLFLLGFVVAQLWLFAWAPYLFYWLDLVRLATFS